MDMAKYWLIQSAISDIEKYHYGSGFIMDVGRYAEQRETQNVLINI